MRVFLVKPSNELTVFSILDTEKRIVDSYYFDTVHPERPVVKFDSFPLRNHVAVDTLQRTVELLEIK